jgi:hypothetical protein
MTWLDLIILFFKIIFLFNYIIIIKIDMCIKKTLIMDCAKKHLLI